MPRPRGGCELQISKSAWVATALWGERVCAGEMAGVGREMESLGAEDWHDVTYVLKELLWRLC